MTATDNLRRMLDERGVEWKEGSPNKTKWSRDGIEYVAVNAWPRNGGFETKLILHANITPEQAIAATLGPVTCRQEERGWGTEGDHARVFLTCGHDCMVETVADLPNFCPVCGARVVVDA